MKSNPNKYICIEGNIGAGKTTLCQLMSLDFPCKIILEQFTENPFLEYFYKDPKRYALTVELFFLTERQKQIQQEASNLDLFNDFIISDYTILKSLLFARANLEPDEYKLFFKVYQALTQGLPKPDLIVYIHREIKHVQNNISKRGRLFENEITDTYLNKIQDSYFDFFKNQTVIPIVVIDIANQDFTQNQNLFNELTAVLFTKYTPGLHHIKILN
ncbi:MAG: deoxynucleoside kinase [Saprospiraceae bacterium]|jgi:deoxyadenosine/deoxycytidine kinase|nr:deoxynucleoside kinase [Saprospiraceae bacterium]